MRDTWELRGILGAARQGIFKHIPSRYTASRLQAYSKHVASMFQAYSKHTVWLQGKISRCLGKGALADLPIRHQESYSHERLFVAVSGLASTAHSKQKNTRPRIVQNRSVNFTFTKRFICFVTCLVNTVLQGIWGSQINQERGVRRTLEKEREEEVANPCSKSTCACVKVCIYTLPPLCLQPLRWHGT